MSCDISPVTSDPAELRAVAIVSTDAMCQGDRGPSEFIKSGWPGIGTPAGVDLAQRRFSQLQSQVAEPHFFLKAVEKETGETLGMAMWTVRDEHPLTLPNQPPMDLPDESARQYAQAMKTERNKMIIAAHRRLPDGPVAELLNNHVITGRQRSGVGTQMVKYIISLCNTRNMPIVLTANPHAMGFYQRLGFTVVEDRYFELPPPFHDRPQARIATMIRPVG